MWHIQTVEYINGKEHTRVARWIQSHRGKYVHESQKHNVEQNESDTEDNILYNLIFIKFINSENVSFLIVVRFEEDIDYEGPWGSLPGW